MPSFIPDSRRLDQRTWSIATRSLPLVIQLVLGVAVIATWLLGRWSALGDDFTRTPRAAVIGAVSMTAVGFVIIAAVLFRRDTATARGLGLSAAACAAVTLIGGVPYAVWLL